MKTRNAMKAVVLMSLVAVGAGVVMMREKGTPAREGEGKSQAVEVAGAVSEVKGTKAEAGKRVEAPKGLRVVKDESGGEAGVVKETTEAGAVVAQLRADDVELAYQLGQDLTELTAEGRARLKADWEAQVQQTQQEQASVEQ